jgi:hypothetical protein
LKNIENEENTDLRIFLLVSRLRRFLHFQYFPTTVFTMFAVFKWFGGLYNNSNNTNEIPQDSYPVLEPLLLNSDLEFNNDSIADPDNQLESNETQSY